MTRDNDGRPAWLESLKPLLINIFGGVILLFLTPVLTRILAWILDAESFPREIRYPDWVFLSVAFLFWLITTHLLSWRRGEGQARVATRVLHGLLTFSALLMVFIPLTRKKDAIVAYIQSVEESRITSKMSHLYRAVHRAFLVYDKHPQYLELFRDSKHTYSDMTINFFEIGTAAVSHYELKGKTIGYRESEQITLPLATNVELPFRPESLVFVSDLTGGEEVPIPFALEEIGVEYKTFLYRLAFDDFPDLFHYKRLFHHPTSQTFNPEAFLMFLDFIESDIQRLSINLYTDEPIARALLVEPVGYDARRALFSWRDVPTSDSGRIPTGDLVDPPQQFKYGEARIVDGFNFRFEGVPGLNKRMVLVYFKGQTESRQFLG